MKIYKIRSDSKYKDLTGEDGVIRKFHSFEGQSLLSSWYPLSFRTLETLDENGIQKVDDYDARCYGNIFIVHKIHENTFASFFGNSIELLPVIVDGNSDTFLFVNVIDNIPAINTEGIDYSEIMERFRNNNVQFYFDNIKDKYLFRDTKANNLYYCTEGFIAFINRTNISGLQFEYAGFAQ